MTSAIAFRNTAETALNGLNEGLFDWNELVNEFEESPLMREEDLDYGYVFVFEDGSALVLEGGNLKIKDQYDLEDYQ